MITTIIAAAATSAFVVCACFLAYTKGREDGENNAYRDMEASVKDIAALATMGAMANMPSNTNAAPKSEN